MSKSYKPVFAMRVVGQGFVVMTYCAMGRDGLEKRAARTLV
jgi:hypothetical protein